MIKEEFKLDNPIWYPLSETHRDMQLNLMVVNFINQNTVLLAELEQYLMNLWQ